MELGKPGHLSVDSIAAHSIMRLMLTELLAPYRPLDTLRIDDLVHHAAEIVPQVAGPQWRHKVTAIPDARTVRYYIQQGLVDPPHGSSGSAALYRYRHLLQLVTVKVLQSHYLPIRRIKETIDQLTDQELEKLLEGWREPLATPQPPAGSATTLLRGYTDAATPFHSVRESPNQPQSARAFLESIQTERPERPDQLAQLFDSLHGDDQLGSVRSGPPAGWTRYELYPGIDLVVKEGVQVPSSASFLSALASRLRVILEKLKRSGP